jgi:hypothetical protein
MPALLTRIGVDDRLLRHVALDEKCVDRGGRLRTGRIAVDDADRRAFVGETGRTGKADALRAAGDQNRLAREPHRRSRWIE